MTNILGRLFLCIVCGYPSDNWDAAVAHMAFAHLDIRSVQDHDLARMLTTIKLESKQEKR